MKVVVDGKEIKYQNFADVKPGGVLGVGQCIYVKTINNQLCSLVNGSIENYNNQPIVAYPDAVLLIETSCHGKKEFLGWPAQIKVFNAS